ncbi:hypothetical protein WT83_29030 [Burkholderia territorii]|uniref:Putative DNA-binding domain-containing protein n=1 Tax=Burkholderia territorii TaxID=1503055 RepID=A0A108E6H4_9BURK|nr:putative DNA-binding domain-containing protein [Burkholderia territorii]KWN05607.1 hypothetical protein WT83_29030 [Burkholderia territorii]
MSYAALLNDIAHALVDKRHVSHSVVAHTCERLSIYRNNAKVNRIAALADAFANVVMLVGGDYFRALARAYVNAESAKSANLHDDGSTLPVFIRDFAPAAELPYLADIAQVDWLLHRAYFADNATPLEPPALACLDAQRFARATLRLMPSVGVARSKRWPIADILSMNAGGCAARLDAGAQSVLVWRDGHATRWIRLDPPDAELAEALLRGSTLATAIQSSGAVSDGLLVRFFRDRLVVSVEENQT